MGPYDHISTHVVDPLAGWLDDALHDFGARQENQIHYFAVEGLAVPYCLALTQAHAVAAKKPARADEARNLTNVVLRWVAWLPGEEVGDVLLDPGTAEMVWSALVTLSFTADDPSLLGEAAEAILEKLGDRLGEAAPVHDTFSLEFVTGILVAAGCPEEEISSAWSHLQDERRWGGSYRGMYIDSLRPSAFVEPKPSSDRGSTLMGRDQSVGS